MSRPHLTRKMMDDFRRIVQMLRSAHRAASKANLTGAQLFVLTTLSEARRPLSVSEVAEQTRTDPSTVSVVVNRLVRKGLVHRTRAEDDARRNELTLTARGLRAEKSAPPTVAQQALARALDALDRDDAETLSAILHRICIELGCADAPAPMMFEDPQRRRKRQ